MEALTVEKLLECCKEEVAKGNGKKVIMISQDDEGNGYHYLWYAFASVEDVGAEDDVHENVAKKEDTIILG